MPEITRRNFVEGKGALAEEEDGKARELSHDVRAWSSYCIFLPDRFADDTQAEIRKNLPTTFLRPVVSKQPAGTWIRGAHCDYRGL